MTTTQETQTTDTSHLSQEFVEKMQKLIEGSPALTLKDALEDKELCQMVQQQLDEQKQLAEQTMLEKSRLAKAAALADLKVKMLGSTQKLTQELKAVASRPSNPEDLKKWIVSRQQANVNARGVISPSFTFENTNDPNWAIAWRGALCFRIKKLQDLSRIFQGTEDGSDKKKLSLMVAMVQSHIEAITVVLGELYKISDPKGLKSKYSFKELDYKLYEDMEANQKCLNLLNETLEFADHLKEVVAKQQSSSALKNGPQSSDEEDLGLKFGGNPPPVPSASRSRRHGKKEKKNGTRPSNNPIAPLRQEQSEQQPLPQLPPLEAIDGKADATTLVGEKTTGIGQAVNEESGGQS